MANASECAGAIYTAKANIMTALNRLGYTGPCDYASSLKDLLEAYSGYAGKPYDMDVLMAPSEELYGVIAKYEGHLYECRLKDDPEAFVPYYWAPISTAQTLVEKTITTDGTYDPADDNADGYSRVIVSTAAIHNLQNKTVTPSDTLITVQADKGFSGLGTVTVKPIQVENGSAVPSASQQIILPTDGKFFKQFTVDAVINQVKQVTPGTATQLIQPDSGYNGLSQVTVQGDSDLLPENIVAGVSIFGVSGTATAGAASGKPIEVSTVADMNTRRSNASASTLGTIYKYTGATSGDYVQNALYIVDVTDSVYTLRKISESLMQLNSTTLAIADSVLSWSAVPYATRYAVYSNDAIIAYATTTSYTLIQDLPGVYSIYVKAIATGYADSNSSNTVIWRVGNAVITKHGVVTFPVSTLATVSTEFNNKAVFCGNNLNNTESILYMYDPDLTGTSLSNYSTCKAIAATNQYMMYTDNSSIYRYDNNMTTQVGSLGQTRVAAPSACAVGNYIIFAGGMIDNGMQVPVNDAEAFDGNMVRTQLSALNAYTWNMAAVTHRNYAIFGGGQLYVDEPNIADYNIYTTAYDNNLVKVTIPAMQTGCASMAATTVGNYAIFAGGTYTLGNTYWSNAAATYDENLNTVFPTTAELSVGRSDLAATNLGGFAIFGGGTTESGPSSVVDVFDAALVHTDAEDLTVARSSLSAATVGNYAIFAGTATSMYSDVYTIQSTN